jgi:hypothetical protein
MKAPFSLVIAFVVASSALAQPIYNLSLKEVRIDTDNHTFKVMQILDGRTDKESVGWVQTGIGNRRRIAVFEKGFDGEVVNLFKRSGLFDSTGAGNSLVVVLKRLYINEHTEAMSETGRVQLALNFFKPVSIDSCLYLTSVFADYPGSGFDVTHTHDDRIAAAFAMSIERFKTKVDKYENAIVHRSQITDPSRTLRDVDNLAILNATQSKDGVFTTFRDFANNISTLENYTMKPGKNPAKTLKVFQVRNNMTVRVKNEIFGVAHANKLYVLLDGHFYELAREGNNFTFTGDASYNPSVAMAMGGGLIGGLAAAATTSNYRPKYKLDWDFERIIEVGITKE